MSYVGDLLVEARKKAGMSHADVAIATGFKNVTKQIRVLERIESGSDRFPRDEYLERFSRVLGIDIADVIQAMSMEYADYERWCDTPCRLHLRIRWIPGFYGYQSLPDGCTMEEAEAEALKIVHKNKMIVWVVYANARAKIFKPDGTVCEGGPPMMRIGGHGRQLMALAERMAKVPIEKGRPET